MCRFTLFLTGFVIRHNGQATASLATKLITKCIQTAFKSVIFRLNKDNSNICSLVVESLTAAFADLDGRIAKELLESSLDCGSTAIVLLHIDNILFSANIGDSGAFVLASHQSFQLSESHTLVK